MISFGLNIGIRNLIVKKLSAFGTAFDPPGVVIQQASQEPEAFFMRKNIDLDKIGELSDEAVNALFQLDPVTLDLFPQEDFQLVIRKLRSQFLQAALGVVGQA